jgi:hypothetical protein
MRSLRASVRKSKRGKTDRCAILTEAAAQQRFACVLFQQLAATQKGAVFCAHARDAPVCTVNGKQGIPWDRSTAAHLMFATVKRCIDAAFGRHPRQAVFP